MLAISGSYLKDTGWVAAEGGMPEGERKSSLNSPHFLTQGRKNLAVGDRGGEAFGNIADQKNPSVHRALRLLLFPPSAPNRNSRVIRLGFTQDRKNRWPPHRKEWSTRSGRSGESSGSHSEAPAGGK